MNCSYDKEVGCPTNCPYLHLKDDLDKCPLKRSSSSTVPLNKSELRYTDYMEKDMEKHHDKN